MKNKKTTENKPEITSANTTIPEKKKHKKLKIILIPILGLHKKTSFQT